MRSNTDEYFKIFFKVKMPLILKTLKVINDSKAHPNKIALMLVQNCPFWKLGETLSYTNINAIYLYNIVSFLTPMVGYQRLNK